MQIRIANRQDEKKLLPFIEEIYKERGKALDLTRADSDLKNVEASYFGKDGVFLLAEEDQKIIGIAGANMMSDDLCALRRIYVAPDWRRKGIARQMLNVILGIARRFEYKRIVAGAKANDGKIAECGQLLDETKELLQASGFRESTENQGSVSFELDLGS